MRIWRHITVTIYLLLAFSTPAVLAQATDNETEEATTTITAETVKIIDPASRGQEIANGVSSRMADWIAGHTGQWGQIEIVGIQFWRFVASFILLLLTFTLARIVKLFFDKYGARLAAHTRWKVDDMIFKSANRPAALFINSIGVYIASMPLLAVFDPAITTLFARLCMTGAAIAIIWYVYRIIGMVDLLLRKIAGHTHSDLDNTFVDVIRKTLRVFVVIIGVLFIGQSILDLNITALLASAGIFGLAMAFAAQDTIANLFGTVMLLLDKPFKVGERIVLNGAEGPVESIGFRSTRIRTLDGHLVSVPNKEVANVKVQNVSRRPHIKRVSNITITYDTPLPKVQRALEIIRTTLRDHKGMNQELPPRVYFNQFNDCSLNLLMIAWYHPPEYWDFLEWCEETNLTIMREFEKEGIEFAFPTNTTYLAQDDRRPLTITMNADGQQPPAGNQAKNG